MPTAEIIAELEEEMSRIKRDIKGISETRKKSKTNIKLPWGHMLYYKEREDFSLGLYRYYNKQKLNRIHKNSERRMRRGNMRHTQNKFLMLNIIQVYAPTSKNEKKKHGV